MADRERKSIVEMAGGAILERIDYEMNRVMDNILDINTKATAKRKLTLTLELTPDDDRRVINVSTVAKTTLAATNPVLTSLCNVPDQNGEVTAVEMLPQIPGQLSVDEGEQGPAPILRIAK